MGLVKKKRIDMGKVMLWIDENINHYILDDIVYGVFGYSVWNKTCHKFCLWVCDNFEDFDKI